MSRDTVIRKLLDVLLGSPQRGRPNPHVDADRSPALFRDDQLLADQLADGSLDPDEVPSWLEPWDEGSDDEE
jgi:hypothetical protein